MIRRAIRAALPALVLCGAPATAWGQAEATADPAAVVVPENPRAAPAAFGPGEHLVYKVKVGIFGAGEGYMTVHGTDTVRGRDVYHTEMGINGGLAFYKVNDVYSSWFDVRTFQSWRFIRDIDNTGYESYRHYEMYPDRRIWDREDNDEFGDLGSSLPLDDISFVYFLRSLPLDVGKTYTYNRYFKTEGNPVSVTVVRRDRREVGAGEFNTIVVKPTIRTSGLFGEGGEAELHFTDDERHILVYMKTDMPKIPGSLTLHLERIEEGLPLNPRSRAAALERRAAAAADPGR